MAHFLQDRSCNDDFVPILRITRSTCHPNRLEQASYVPNDDTYNPYANANIYFKERKNILSWEPDPRLEAIDARLEEICAAEEEKWNNDVWQLELDELEEELLEEELLEEELGHDGLCQREDFHNDSIRVEDFGLHYYHYQSLILSGMKKQGATK
jgi:hypothetical protein